MLVSVVIVNHTISCLLGKTKRLKQAKEEAVEEINNYRAEREKQFQEYQKEVGME